MSCRNLQYLNCPNPKHRKQLLMSVCIDSSCQNRSLVCYLCQKDNHVGHHTITLDEFLDGLEKRADSSVDKEILDEAARNSERVATMKSQCGRLMADFRKNVSVLVDGIERQVEGFFAGMDLAIEVETEQYLTSMGKGFEYNHKKRVEKVLDEFRKNLKYYEQKEKSKDSILKDIVDKVDKSTALSKQIQQTLQQIYANFSDSMRKLQSKLTENSLPIESTLSSSTRGSRTKTTSQIQQIPNSSKWSQTLKHPDISVSGNTVKRQVQTIKCKHVCIALDTPFQNIQQTQFSFQITIIEKVCGIIFGVCLQSKIRDTGFVRQDWARHRGHGHYLIGDDGMTWSHSDTSVNYKMKSFRFATGDTVAVEFREGTLRFVKGETGEKWEMDVAPVPKGDCYRLCVYLFMKGDSVMLAEYR